MSAESEIDYYEVLQVSPSADQDTISRVFRHLAKRYHPDNGDSGDAERFDLVTKAFRTLSDPEARAQYDAKYESIREAQWRILDQESAGDDVEADRRLRQGILSLLYRARRQDPEKPGLGVFELERLLGCPETHTKFHVWYLKENGLIQRLDSGQYAITAAGVDKAMDEGVPRSAEPARLPREAPRTADGAESDEASEMAPAGESITE